MRLLIIDSNALLHRSFHALPPLTTPAGKQIGAVYGFLLALFRAIKDIKPDSVVATFDTPEPTFRHEEFKEYKAKRKKAPREFYEQIPIAKETLLTFSIPIFAKEGFEADDLIATITEKISQTQIYPKPEIFILTGDFDTLQLVDKNIKIYTLGRGVKETVIYDKEKVMEKFSLRPDQIVDFKALKGDPSDNIPGAPGIGEKIALELLKKYDNLENIYKAIKKNTFQLESKGSEKIKEILLKNKEQVFFSKILVEVRKDAPIEFNLDKSRFNFNLEKVEEFFKKLGFYSLIKRLSELKKF